MISILLASTLSLAADTNDQVGAKEIYLRESWLGATDNRWDAFSSDDTYRTVGLQVGYRIAPRVTLIGGWQHGGVEMDTSVGDDGGYYVARFRGDQAGFGARADFPVADWVHPYAGLQAIGMFGRIRLDDQPAEDDNANELRFAGASGGALGTGGLEFRIAMDGGYAVLFDAEFGYGWVAPMTFDTLGNLPFSGLSSRIGAGVRF